jgi:hypothetical protein
MNFILNKIYANIFAFLTTLIIGLPLSLFISVITFTNCVLKFYLTIYESILESKNKRYKPENKQKDIWESHIQRINKKTYENN